jgi:hypothetical protein
MGMQDLKIVSRFQGMRVARFVAKPVGDNLQARMLSTRADAMRAHEGRMTRLLLAFLG